MILLAVLAALSAATQGPMPTTVIDRFDRLEGWTPHPAEGVELTIRSDRGRTGRAMRLDFGFRSGGGYAIARRAVAIDLPNNYRFSFWIRGAARNNTLEFKLIDSTGENVWWYTERDRAFSPNWQQVTIRKRQITFAWGPAGGGMIRHVAALEIVITAGTGGGTGSVWVDDLGLTPLPETGASAPTPRVRASSSEPGHGAELVADGDTATSWRAPASSSAAMLTIDLQASREFGGLTLLWEASRAPRALRLLLSDDGRTWRERLRTTSSLFGRDYLYLPDSESRFVRLLLSPRRGAGLGLRELRVVPPERWASKNDFLAAVARETPQGSYPRYLVGERADWTVVGTDGAPEEALLSEDGALEAGAGAFTVEPFVQVGDRFLSWSDVTSTTSLAEGRLPIPSVEWAAGNLTLTITAFTTGPAAASSLVARYRLDNRGSEPLQPTLYLAILPFQVNPPSQFLGTPGGFARIDSLRWTGSRVIVNGGRQIVPLDRPAQFGAASFESGGVVELLRRRSLPSARSTRSALGAASGALAWPLSIAPGDSAVVAIEIPLVSGRPALLSGKGPRAADSALRVARQGWIRKLDRATISLPPAGMPIAQTITSTLGYILINRDGSALQPGSRSYERSWIRDGALTGAALLRFGFAEVVREFLLWYATYQYPNGKVPCCVDYRGADPVAEHDSHGELIYLIAEYYRHTGDRALLERLWPNVLGATRYLDSLRRSRRTEEFRSGEKRRYHGLLPPSISHEGYSAKPMHSYWDDFFALRGFKDAVAVATALGKTSEAVRLAAVRDEFAADLYASIDEAMAQHGIDYIPGAADLGDFDATSTTIAVSPGGELDRLPRAALLRTFERYWQTASARSSDTSQWEAYTPYELRAVGTLLRIGWKDRALALLDLLIADQEPPGWNQWPEVVWRNRRALEFIGDLPHTWVGSDFLRSASDLFAYEREGDSTLVIGQGIPEAWLADGGVEVRGLSTWWGPLSYSARRDRDGLTVSIDPGLRVPSGGVLVYPPGRILPSRVIVNGASVPLGQDRGVIVRVLPARIRFVP